MFLFERHPWTTYSRRCQKLGTVTVQKKSTLINCLN